MPPQTSNLIDQKPKDFFPPKIFIILILLVGILGSCQIFYSSTSEKVGNLEVKNEISEWKTYRNEEWGFEVEYPAVWTLYLKDAKERSVYGLVSPETKECWDKSASCTDYSNRTITDVSVSVGPYLEPKKFDFWITFGSINIGKIKWYYYSDEGSPQYTTYFINLNETSYQIGVNSLVVKEDVVRQILSTFKFISTSTETMN